MKFCIKCGLDQPEDSRFCRKCGYAFPNLESPPLASPPATAETEGASIAATIPAAAPSASTSTVIAQTAFNFGTWIFAGFSVLSLIVAFARGIVPIYLGEAAGWAVLAWWWQKTNPKSQIANALVLLLAVVLAAGEGFLIGRQPAENYTYLQQGNTQVRVNPSTGRTDRLTTDGWMPISYDKPPETLDPWQAPTLTLTNGVWKNTFLDNGEVCFDVENGTQYTVQDLSIVLTFDPKPANTSSFDDVFNSVTLKKFIGGLLATGKSAEFCGKPGVKLPPDAKWSYQMKSYSGWKER